MPRIKQIQGNLYGFTPPPIDEPRGAALFDEGTVAEADRQIQKAFELYQQAVICDPLHVGAWINLGTIFYHRRDFIGAEECYQKAIEIAPNYVTGHFNLANVFDVKGKFQEAAGEYLETLRFAPNYADAYFNLALCQEKLLEWGKALKYWRLYLRYHCDDDEIWTDQARRKVQNLSKRTGISITQKPPTSIASDQKELPFSAEQ